MTEWYQQLDGHDFEQVLVLDDGQGSLRAVIPGVGKESDMTE